MPFLSELNVHWVSSSQVQLDTPLQYKDRKGRVWTVPAGFITDLESRPTFLPGFINFFLTDQVKTARAAVVHDYLYREHILTRAESDAIYYDALREEGVNLVGAYLGWAGLRVGGWLAWSH